MPPSRFAPFLAVLPLLACDGGEPETSLEPGDPHVLVLILDGVRVEEITSDWVSDVTGVTGEAHAHRTWAEIGPDATIVRSIQNTVLASTAPGHAAIVMGRAEPIFTVGFGDQGAAFYRPQLPTIFEEARQQKGWGGPDVVLLANSVVMQAVNRSVYPGLEEFPGTWEEITRIGSEAVEDDDTRTFSLVKDAIRSNPPPVLVVNFHDADRLGHADGDYAGRVTEQDNELADLWAWLQTSEEAYLDGLLVVVTSDHGRHRHDLDGGWNNHGDSCDGCREVPLLLFGDGVPGGVVAEGTFSLVDVAPTLAAHLGIDLPWAQGLPLSTLVDSAGLDGRAGRSGQVDVSVSGGHIATRVWKDSFESRSEVQVDGVVVSTPDLFAAEAPTVLAGVDRTFVCFREFSAVVDANGYLPWTPRCLQDDGTGWADIGFPEDAVGPFWAPVLAEKDGVLWVAWLRTPLTRGADGADGARLASWSPRGGWLTIDGPTVPFTTTDITMALSDRGFLLTGAINLPDPTEPYTRRTAAWAFDAAGADRGTQVEFPLEELLSDPHRVERPAVRAVGAHVDLAMIALDASQRFIGYASSEDGGTTWTDPVALPAEGDAFVHLTPQWDGDYVVWGALLDDGTAGLCRVRPTDTAAACVSTGSPRLDSFAVASGVATVSIDAGIGAWELTEVSW